MKMFGLMLRGELVTWSGAEGESPFFEDAHSAMVAREMCMGWSPYPEVVALWQTTTVVEIEVTVIGPVKEAKA